MNATEENPDLVELRLYNHGWPWNYDGGFTLDDLTASLRKYTVWGRLHRNDTSPVWSMAR